MFKHLFNYLQDNNLLSKDQSGFQPGDSTVNQLTYIYHIFAEALDHKKDIQIVFCDISKAFDRVWHKAFIYKLKKVGISGRLFARFIDYLKDRHGSAIRNIYHKSWVDPRLSLRAISFSNFSKLYNYALKK